MGPQVSVTEIGCLKLTDFRRCEGLNRAGREKERLMERGETFPPCVVCLLWYRRGECREGERGRGKGVRRGWLLRDWKGCVRAVIVAPTAIVYDKSDRENGQLTKRKCEERWWWWWCWRRVKEYAKKYWKKRKAMKNSGAGPEKKSRWKMKNNQQQIEHKKQKKDKEGNGGNRRVWKN